MVQGQTAVETALSIQRTFSASREKVFRAWTEPEAMKRWFGCGHGFSVPSAEVDLRVDGAFRVGMRSPREESHVVTGTSEEVRPPERLAFTWAGVEGGMDIGEP